ADEIDGERRRSVILAFGPTVLHGDVATFDKPGIGEPLPPCVQIPGGNVRRAGAQKANDRHRLLLRMRWERPGDSSPDGEGQKIAAVHSITSSWVISRTKLPCCRSIYQRQR